VNFSKYSPLYLVCSTPFVALININSLDKDRLFSIFAYLIELLKLAIFLYKRTRSEVDLVIIDWLVDSSCKF